MTQSSFSQLHNADFQRALEPHQLPEDSASVAASIKRRKRRHLRHLSRSNYALNDFDDNYSESDMASHSMVSGSLVNSHRNFGGGSSNAAHSLFIDASGFVPMVPTSLLMRDMACEHPSTDQEDNEALEAAGLDTTEHRGTISQSRRNSDDFA